MEYSLPEEKTNKIGQKEKATIYYNADKQVNEEHCSSIYLFIDQ